jgi:hypothetical protein
MEQFGPADRPVCPKCFVREIAEATRRQIEQEPWESLPAGWRKLADGWSDFPEDFQKDLKELTIEVYKRTASPDHERGLTSSQKYAYGRPPRREDKLDFFETIVKDKRTSQKH